VTLVKEGGAWKVAAEHWNAASWHPGQGSAS
jgi:hypothetical protein